MSDFIPVNDPVLGEEEKKNLIECIDTNWISSGGPFVKKFENQLKELTNREHALTVANGTAALEVALKALGIQAGDEVILPSFTIISCAQAISKLGATPVVVDVNSTSITMKVEQIEAVITPKTKAIMAVHLYGLPADMTTIQKIADQHQLWIIEDAAEAMGQTFQGRPCGSFGTVSTLSFYPNKHITTGEGGAILTNDREVHQKCIYYHNLCFDSHPEKRFIHEELGWNYRFTNLQAAVGVAQADKLAYHIERKKIIGKKYNESLSAYSNYLQLPLDEWDGEENIFWVYTLVLKDNFPLDAAMMIDELAKEKIGTRPFFYPIHKQPVYQSIRSQMVRVDLSNSEKLYQRGLYLPSGIGLTETQQDRVIEIVIKIVEKVTG